MAEKYTFKAVIEDAGNNGAFVTVPFDVEQAFGKKRVKIKAKIAGIPYQGSLVRMGTEDHILIILKEIRAKAGITFGDEIEIELEEDLEPRVVILPEDVKTAFEDQPGAQAFFSNLSYTNQKEYIDWIVAAKRDDTRQNRIEKMIDLLNQGKKGRYA